MSCVIIFDNNYFSENIKIIINNIKRWICYKLNNLLFNDIITIIKLNPYSKKEFIMNEDIFSTIIIYIYNIIYKKYICYPEDNIKLIFNEIDNNNNNYLIISSIDNLNFEQNLKDSIKEKINLNNITIINIGKKIIFSYHFPSIKEYLIDFRLYKIENIVFDDNINFKKFMIKDYFELDNISNFEKQGEENNEGYIYFKKLENLEKNILKKLLLKDYIEIDCNILNEEPLYLKNYKKLKNLLNSWRNNLLRIVQRNFTNNIFKIKIVMDYPLDYNIKYIAEFYEIIYPKLLNNFIDNNNKNYKKKEELNIIIIKNYEKLDNNLITDDSINIAFSNTTISSWLDEYNQLNPFGILINFNISKFGYKGLLDETSSFFQNYPETVVNNITNNWISLLDYYQLITAYLNEQDEIKYIAKDTFNLNSFLIQDVLYGNTNVMLPLYFNKKHWGLTKAIWKFHLSFIFNSFENEYTKKMDNVYFLVIIKLFNKISNNFNEKKTLDSIGDNDIRLFCYILRTTIQILIDNKYIGNIKKEYNKFFDYIKNINTNNYDNFNNFKNLLIDFKIRIIQYIISSNSLIKNIQQNFLELKNIIYNFWLYKYNKNNSFNNLDEEIKFDNENINLDYYENLNNKFIEDSKSWFLFEKDIINFANFINEIYAIKGFNQFIKYLDNNNGCIELDNNLLCCNNLKEILFNIIS